jgi:hypothetical protein
MTQDIQLLSLGLSVLSLVGMVLTAGRFVFRTEVKVENLEKEMPNKASKEYVDGLSNSVIIKVDALTNSLTSFKQDMDRQFNMLREDLARVRDESWHNRHHD